MTSWKLTENFAELSKGCFSRSHTWFVYIRLLITISSPWAPCSKCETNVMEREMFLRLQIAKNCLRHLRLESLVWVLCSVSCPKWVINFWVAKFLTPPPMSMLLNTFSDAVGIGVHFLCVDIMCEFSVPNNLVFLLRWYMSLFVRKCFVGGSFLYKCIIYWPFDRTK